MTDPSVSAEDLSMFRFQIFYEDTVNPLLGPDVRFAIQHPIGIFARGELREATAIAALAVACGVFPGQPFRSMLEDNQIQELLAADVSTFGRETPVPVLITELPSREDALEWSELEMDDRSKLMMPDLVDEYTSLMRQIHRNASQRYFNAEMLFSPEETWQVDLRALASTAGTRFPARGFEGRSIWLAEGLDSYLNLATDLGVTWYPDTSSGFVSVAHVGKEGKMNADDIKEMIGRQSPLALMAWRFGGAPLADVVTQRVRNVENVIARVVAEVDFEQVRTVQNTEW